MVALPEDPELGYLWGLHQMVLGNQAAPIDCDNDLINLRRNFHFVESPTPATFIFLPAPSQDDKPSPGDLFLSGKI